MKAFFLVAGILSVMAFTHPFAEQGSVTTDNQLLEERIEKAHENQLQQQRADKVIKQQRQEEQMLPAEVDKGKRKDMNEAEKLVD